MTSHSDIPVSIDPSVFMPKNDRDKLTFIIHHMYRRLGYLDAKIETADAHGQLSRHQDERDWLSNVLDCFERS